MLVSDYNNFVKETDLFKDKSDDERKEIALYGLVGEIGSLVTAIKKKLLGEAGQSKWNKANQEIVEELGDVIWYCFSFSQVLNPNQTANIFIQNIASIKKDITSDTEVGRLFSAALDRAKKDEFLEAAKSFPDTKDMCLDDYQALAFLTARTSGRELLEVCIAALWQLGAKLLRCNLPEVEIKLNKQSEARKENLLLGDIAWHVAAVAKLYGQSMDDIAQKNVEKVGFRRTRDVDDKEGSRRPFFDEGYPEEQQFPRRFDISFVSVSADKARMYYQGKQLGNELTDNTYDDDGYRFHDAMHLAHAAYMGWSPVLRSLLKRKRKNSAIVDRNEDGARAQIVEELVIAAIHAEGDRQAAEHSGFFKSKGQITFKFIKSLRRYVEKFEAKKCEIGEWEEAIFAGGKLYGQLREEGQGTVTVDMESRTLTFSPHVNIDINGGVAGIGTATMSVSSGAEAVRGTVSPRRQEDVALAKQAILQSLGLSGADKQMYELLQVTFIDDHRVSVKASGPVQDMIWDKQIVCFKVSFASTADNVSCTALALVDPKDAVA